MGVEHLKFHERIKEYRKDYLNITATEAASILNIGYTAYSNYENGIRQFPLELIPVIKEKFVISDELFLEMFLERPRKRQNVKTHVERTNEIKAQYSTKFAEDFFEFVTIREVRTMLAIMRKYDPKYYKTLVKELNDYMKNSPEFQKALVKPNKYILNKNKLNHTKSSQDV